MPTAQYPVLLLAQSFCVPDLGAQACPPSVYIYCAVYVVQHSTRTYQAHRCNSWGLLATMRIST